MAFAMPFGKHKGKTLDQVPAGYLGWLLDNVESMYPETRRAIETYLGRAPSTPAPASEVQRDPASQPARRPRQRTPADIPRDAPRCDRCGQPASPTRPLIHADCVTDEVPF